MLRLRVGVRNEFVRVSLGITNINQKLRESRFRCLDNIKRREGKNLEEVVRVMMVEGEAKGGETKEYMGKNDKEEASEAESSRGTVWE